MFGFVRTYCGLDSLPTHDPDRPRQTQPLCESELEETPAAQPPTLGPFENESAFSLGEWYWSGNGQKSLGDFFALLRVLKSPNFRLDDVSPSEGHWKKAFRNLGANKEDLPDGEGDWIEDDGWMKTPIVLEVPFHARSATPGISRQTVGTLHHRSVVSVIKEALADKKRAPLIHYHPYRLSWNRHPSVPEVHVQGELYTSEAFLQAHQELQASEPEPGCNRERLVIALMFSSDGTQLSNFTDDELWPCYLQLGNESKYRRAKGLKHMCDHIAYFEPVRPLSSLISAHRM
jgi:hypothetical protein